MTDQEEQFVHFVSSLRNLNNAWRLLQEIRRCEGNALVGAAFRFALIEYSKPYRNSYGVALTAKGNSKRYKLDDRFIPATHRALHERILQARDKIHAHSDLSVMDAKLYVRSTPRGSFATIVQNVTYGTEELANISAIIELVEKALEAMYDEEKRLETLLPSGGAA